MAGSSVQIIRGSSSTEYLGNAFRDSIILVVINLEPKQVDTKKSVAITGNPDSVIVPRYGSSKITVFVWGKNIILKFLGNTK